MQDEKTQGLEDVLCWYNPNIAVVIPHDQNTFHGTLNLLSGSLQLPLCSSMHDSVLLVLYALKKKRVYLFIFRERGREREREGEKHQCVVASLTTTPPPPGIWPATWACAQTGNRTSNSLVCRPALSPLIHTSQGCFLKINKLCAE